MAPASDRPDAHHADRPEDTPEQLSVALAAATIKLADDHLTRLGTVGV